MSIQIFSPSTVVSGSRKGSQVLSVNSKSGLFSFPDALVEHILTGLKTQYEMEQSEVNSFHVVHDSDDRTSYLIINQDGFNLRVGKDNKGLNFNSTSLATAIATANNITSRSFKFRVVNPTRIVIEGNDTIVFPLIKLSV